MALNDSVPSVKKLNEQITSLLEKKQVLLTSVGNEISALNAAVRDMYAEIGAKAYDMYTKGGFEHGRLTGEFEKVTGLKRNIAEKERQSADIAKRYDEEITLLNNLLPQCGHKTVSSAPQLLQ